MESSETAGRQIAEFSRERQTSPLESGFLEGRNIQKIKLSRIAWRELVRLFTTEGKGIKELARGFGVSQRTVQRALGRAKNG